MECAAETPNAPPITPHPTRALPPSCTTTARTNRHTSRLSASKSDARLIMCAVALHRRQIVRVLGVVVPHAVDGGGEARRGAILKADLDLRRRRERVRLEARASDAQLLTNGRNDLPFAVPLEVSDREVIPVAGVVEVVAAAEALGARLLGRDRVSRLAGDAIPRGPRR